MAIFPGMSAPMTVTHSRIQGNLAAGNEGGGIYFKPVGTLNIAKLFPTGTAKFRRRSVRQPQAQTRIGNCLIVGNVTTAEVTYYHGGGIYIGVDGTNTVESRTIAGNQDVERRRRAGPGVYAGNLVFNCIVYSNSAGVGDRGLVSVRR